MLLLRTDALREGPNSTYELKLDGFRALAYKSAGAPRRRSRNNKSFDGKYPAIVEALATLPDETVIDGEIVALDESGRLSFGALQNGAPAALVYYVFDVLVLAGRNVKSEPLSARRELLQRDVSPRLSEPIREAPRLDVPLAGLIRAVREQGLEGLATKSLDSVYQPGERSGAWRKMRVNRAEEFVIGGCTIGGRHFDALILGYWDEERLLYAARTRSGLLQRSGSSCSASSAALRRLSATCPSRGPAGGARG